MPRLTAEINAAASGFRIEAAFAEISTAIENYFAEISLNAGALWTLETLIQQHTGSLLKASRDSALLKNALAQLASEDAQKISDEVLVMLEQRTRFLPARIAAATASAALAESQIRKFWPRLKLNSHQLSQPAARHRTRRPARRLKF